MRRPHLMGEKKITDSQGETYFGDLRVLMLEFDSPAMQASPQTCAFVKDNGRSHGLSNLVPSLAIHD